MNEEFDKEKFDELLDEFIKLPPFKEKRNPTFLEIIKQPSRETAWSNILAFYFDPNKEHELGDLMLKSFFEALGETVEMNNFNSIKVRTEVSTENRKRIDIVIESDNFVLGIENKVDHWLDNDLEEYSRKIDELLNGKTPFKVVLSKFHCKPYSGFKNLTYEVLIKHIRENLPSFITNGNLEYVTFLKDFLRNIENVINFKEMIENKECLEYFRNNYDEISKLSLKFGKIKDEVNQKFRELHEAIDLSELDGLLKRKFGGNANVDKAEIEFCNDGLAFWICVNTKRGHIIYEIAIYGVDVYCSASTEAETYQNRIIESDEFGLNIDISEDTKEAAQNIAIKIKEIIDNLIAD